MRFNSNYFRNLLFFNTSVFPSALINLNWAALALIRRALTTRVGVRMCALVGVRVLTLYAKRAMVTGSDIGHDLLLWLMLGHRLCRFSLVQAAISTISQI